MNNEYIRLVIRVYGIVQGVGFRPFIFRLAREHGLKGTVRNTSGQVEIDVEGTPLGLEGFLADIRTRAPAAARIEQITTEQGPAAGHRDFKIIESLPQPGHYQPLSPDLATCPACRAEIFDPANRRYRYPFTNCTNCGPRFTIITDIPYDRPATTMQPFTMCPDCLEEYHDPADRRFHAQPNACPVCGPSLQLADCSGKAVEGDVIGTAAGLLLDGRIIALKGLGGFQLACDATNEASVARLRQRKNRPAKPLAVMVKDITHARKLCRLSPDEERLLASPASPIVLARTAAGSLAPAIAPGLKYLGIMLPYTPLHHLLMQEAGIPLVMTSGNLSEEPIACADQEALTRLSNIADYFILHNRDIYSRYDDSVTMWAAGAERVIRRARGYAPLPVELAFDCLPVLGTGADMKGSFCLARGKHAFLSQYIGDLDNAEALKHYEQTLGIYRHLFRIEPATIACDLHPDYQSTRYAEKLQSEMPGSGLVRVQHHHAHIASIMAENGEEGPVIGVALDGTGYGSDGAIWGGEFMLVGYQGFKRLAHLEYLPLPGGDAATRKPYRTAAGYLYRLMGREYLEKLPWFCRLIAPEEFGIMTRQIDRQINTPLTSSCGRLFDAVAALTGVNRVIEYEAQAAIELEMAATGTETGVPEYYPFEVSRRGEVKIIGLKGLFNAIIEDIKSEMPPEVIAARFHQSLAAMIARVCRRLSEETGTHRIALSGGVFQNRLLLRLVANQLENSGLAAITHRIIPSNDSCIALGQVAVAHHLAQK